MTDSRQTKHFLERIMDIRVTTMGGATASIIGSPDPSESTVNILKRTAYEFARERSKASPDDDRLNTLADEISGLLQTLRVMPTLSEKTVAELHDELDALRPANR